MKIFSNARVDFNRWRWHAVVLSVIVIGAGIAMMLIRGLPLGIDFSGGFLRRMRRDPLATVVSLSLNQTLSRTIITAGTTFLAALALYIYGGEALRGFAFTMLVGVVTGTYSTMFIASALAVGLSGREGAVRQTL